MIGLFKENHETIIWKHLTLPLVTLNGPEAVITVESETLEIFLENLQVTQL